MIGTIRHAPLVGLLLLLGSPDTVAQDFSIVAKATPANYTGQCPVKITFDVAVTAAKAGPFSLKMDTFDHDLSPNYLLTFAQAGTQTIQVVRNQAKSASGWVLFQGGKVAASNKVPFNVVCTNPPPPAPGDPTTSFTPGTNAPSPYPKPGAGNAAPVKQAPARLPPSR